MPANASTIKITERMLTRLKLKQVRLLVAVSEQASILHAAHALNMSQPTATKLIKDIEADLGILLFRRTNRGVVPTGPGTILIKHGKLVLAQLAHAAQEMDDLNEGLGGRVIVGTLLAASASLLPGAIAQLHEHRPGVSVAIREGTNDVLMPQLMSGDVDLVVGRLPEYRHRNEVVQEILLEERVCVVARPTHPLANQKRIELAELAAFDWILPPLETTLRRQIAAEFQNRDLPLPVCRVESVSFLTNRRLLSETDLIGVFPFHVIEQEIRNSTLAVLDYEMNSAAGPIGVSYRRGGSLSPAADAFLHILRSSAIEMKAPVAPSGR